MKFINLIATILEVKKEKIKLDHNINLYNWDSMAKINLITAINKKYKKNIDVNKFQKIKTIKDLNSLIDKTTK